MLDQKAWRLVFVCQGFLCNQRGKLHGFPPFPTFALVSYFVGHGGHLWYPQTQYQEFLVVASVLLDLLVWNFSYQYSNTALKMERITWMNFFILVKRVRETLYVTTLVIKINTKTCEEVIILLEQWGYFELICTLSQKRKNQHHNLRGMLVNKPGDNSKVANPFVGCTSFQLSSDEWRRTVKFLGHLMAQSFIVPMWVPLPNLKRNLPIPLFEMEQGGPNKPGL